MSDTKEPTDEDNLRLTDEGKLRHELKYLTARLKNLEAFKANFFAVKTELIIAKEKNSTLEQQLVLKKVKDRITVETDVNDLLCQHRVKENDDILEFLKESLRVSEYQELVSSMFHSVEGTGLDMTVLIAHENGSYDFALDETDKEKNIELLNANKGEGSGEFVKIQNDCFVLNLNNLNVLVRNLPVTDEVRAEQIKEFVIIVAMAANSRIDSIKKEIELEALRRNIYQIFKKTRVSFEAVQDNIDNQTIQISEIFLGFEKTLKDSLLKMSLPESYMKMLTVLLHETKTELNILLTCSLTIDEKFLQAIVKLEKAYASKYADALEKEI